MYSDTCMKPMKNVIRKYFEYNTYDNRQLAMNYTMAYDKFIPSSSTCVKQIDLLAKNYTETKYGETVKVINIEDRGARKLITQYLRDIPQYSIESYNSM